MQISLGFVLFALVLPAFAIVIWLTHRGVQVHERRHVEEHVHLASADPRFALDAATAVVVMKSGGGEFSGGWDAFRILRNPHGEYFIHWYGKHYAYGYSVPRADRVFGGSYVQHLTRERAMNALRAYPEAFEREFGTSKRWTLGQRSAGVARPRP